MKRIITAIFLLVNLTAVAQNLDSLEVGEKYSITDSDYNNDSVEMADIMRSNGKIYVVVGVILIIFIGFIIYTISLDRKISKIEKEVFKEKVNS